MLEWRVTEGRGRGGWRRGGDEGGVVGGRVSDRMGVNALGESKLEGRAGVMDPVALLLIKGAEGVEHGGSERPLDDSGNVALREGCDGDTAVGGLEAVETAVVGGDADGASPV